MLDPVGTWSCLVYGHPTLGDERVLLRFEPNGAVGLARPSEDAQRPWVPLSGWTSAGTRLQFADFRTGREFQADLNRSTLGGTWQMPSLAGGWWCSAVSGASAAGLSELTAPKSAALSPPLVLARQMTPLYPRQAIREAKEGRAVACFVVNWLGQIADPELIELSDEIFRAPTLKALEGSRYRGWSDSRVFRPGCRSYTYRLDAVE